MVIYINSRFIKYILDYCHVKDCPVRQKLKKPGGFPPTRPGNPTYDEYGFYSDNYNTKLVAYQARYERWEKYCKPFEEVFGVPFHIIEDKSFQLEYQRKKRLGLLKPLDIKEVNHPLDDIIS